MSNFHFLAPEFSALQAAALRAEHFARQDPLVSALMARRSLEEGVKWLYDNDGSLEVPEASQTLSTLMHERDFEELVPSAIRREMHLLRKLGNTAAHGPGIPGQQESLAAVRALFDFYQWLVRLYSRASTPNATFDETLIPAGNLVERSKAEVAALRAEADNHKIELLRTKENLAQSEAKLQVLQAQLDAIQARKEANQAQPLAPLSLTEAETRKLFIDAALREAGWDPSSPGICEFPVTGMPGTPGGTGKADYVLWGDDGKPVAVVEAKRAQADVGRGQRQAELYANCLEQMTGQRPLIFYTNGFETYLWDDAAGYAPRQVSGFYTADEAKRTINRRTSILPLASASVNKDIAGRYYQEEAIRRVAERLDAKGRGTLLVMATGSGKTRTAAAIVDMLTKCNWAKRILFLADRNALVTQAKNAFNNYLPQLPAIDLTKESDIGSARIVFSTYPTIMNRIDAERVDGQRSYGVGHFDAIIIDEAHRSVYQKFRAIFDYFDALLIGLTATPKADADRDTYHLFGLEAHNPTFNYELDQAVYDKFLVPPRAITVPLKFPREGIRWDELSDADKASFEQDYLETYGEEAPEEVANSAINTWLFNTNTVNTVLDLLLERGLKTEGGDRLGKTIVFAKNHDHAVFIEKCFNQRYPQHGGKMLRVIDNRTYDPQGAINDFSNPANKDFLIAVSVDMLDTGIDIPEVLNLVFFKPVRSKSKFWQMVGRGTRLSPDLFGPGEDKNCFYIFDVCGNIEFFRAGMKEEEPPLQASLASAVFGAKLELLKLLQSGVALSPDEERVATELADALHAEVVALRDDDFRIRRALKEVHRFRDRGVWTKLSDTDILDLHRHIAPLVSATTLNGEEAGRFDQLWYRVMLQRKETGRYPESGQSKIRAGVAGLQRKMGIPAVKAEEALIRAVTDDAYWETAGLLTHDDTRRRLRGLMQYVEKESRRNLYTSIHDPLMGDIEEVEVLGGYTMLESYRKRVEVYLREHRNDLTIHKIRSSKPITISELQQLEEVLFGLGETTGKELFPQLAAGQSLVHFVRSILGMDVGAAKEAFAEFLVSSQYNATQIHFINKIIEALEVKGVVDKRMLFEPPFSHIADDGLLGVFDDGAARRVISILDALNTVGQYSA